MIKKYLKIMLKVSITFCIALVICLTASGKSNADAGYHSSYSGGSSHSSSSHSSSSSHYSSSSRSSSSSSSSSDGASALASLIIFIIIVIIIVASNRKNVSGGTTTLKLTSNQNAINTIKQHLPDFDEKQFLNEGYNIFLDVENAWMNFDLEKIHNCITDEMYNMYESQISSMEIKGEQNIMKDFVLKASSIVGASKQNDNLEIRTQYIIEFFDYIIDKETKKVLRGNSSRKIRMHYEMNFIMSASQEKIENCPNCGAPVEVNSAGTCPYCNSKIVGKNTKWVMSKKNCLRQTNL